MIYTVVDLKRTGEQIKKLMTERGISAETVREQLGLSSSRSVYHWTEGRSLPSVDNLAGLSLLLETSIDEILVWMEVGVDTEDASEENNIEIGN